MAYTKPMKLNLKKGVLHESLGVQQDKKIPESSLDKALGSSSPLMRKRANFAKVAKTWKH